MCTNMWSFLRVKDPGSTVDAKGRQLNLIPSSISVLLFGCMSLGDFIEVQCLQEELGLTVVKEYPGTRPRTAGTLRTLESTPSTRQRG